MTAHFESVDDVRDRLAEAGYLASDAIATTVFLADALGKPLLVEGPAGVGKTELAKAVTSALTGALAEMGCVMPEHLMAAKDANPKGFFESDAITGLNDQRYASGEASFVGGAYHAGGASKYGTKAAPPAPAPLMSTRVTGASMERSA